MSANSLRRGTRLEFRLSSDTYDYQVTPVTIEAHGPNGEVLTWKWRPADPGYSSPEFFYDTTNDKLVWKLTSRWTRDGFSTGSWKLYFLSGDPATSQDNVMDWSLSVKDGKNAPMGTDY